jgi:hypothetical protein
MRVHELYDKFYDLVDRQPPEMLLPWINKLLKHNPNDVDLRYMFLEVLRWNNLDVEDDKEEPQVLKLCTEIIKNKSKEHPITVAKAYSYRGEMRHFGIDRRKDFDKGKEILIGLDQKDKEVIFLKQFIHLLYSLQFRQYLPIYTNYLNMFKIEE